jgi:hypothetical protein
MVETAGHLACAIAGVWPGGGVPAGGSAGPAWGPAGWGAAASPALAAIEQSHLLAVVLMITGAIVLGHALRSRKKNDDGIAGVPLEVAMERLKARARADELAAEVELKPGGGGGFSAVGGEDLRVIVAEARQLRGVLADEADRHAARLEDLIARAEETIRRLETLSHSDAAARSRHSESDRIDPLNRRIYELADQGLPPVEIARNLNQQTGKVELVLALRPR